MDKLNLTITEGYPARNTDTAGLLKDQFVKPPRSSRWYGMHTEKKDCESNTVCTWSPEPVKLNHSFSRVARRSLPTAPPSRAFSQDMLRHWERTAREQTGMCNQTAGLSRCLTRVQDTMSAQLKTQHLDKMASPQHSPRSRLRVQSRVNDNQCVEFVTGQKDSVCVNGQIGLNPPPVETRE